MADNTMEVEVPFGINVPIGLQGNQDKPINQQNPEEPKVEPPKEEGKETKNPSQEVEGKDQLTEEQIQSKLDELSKKEDDKLSEEEKKFIEKYVPPVDEITGIRQSFEQKYGISLADKSYSNDEVGLGEMAEDISKVRANQLVEDYFASIPYMKDFYDHVVVEKKGIETFLAKNVEPSFKSLKLENTSDSNDENVNKQIIANQKAIIKMDLGSKGISEDDINTFIDLYEDKGTLSDKAKEAYKGLETRHKQSVDAKIQAEEARIKEEEAAFIAEYKQMEDMLTKNNFNGVTLPSAEIKTFKDAMLKPVDEQGRTIVDYKRAKLTLAQRAILDYIVFKDFKVQGIGQQAATTNRTFTFKKAAKDNEVRGGGRTSGVNSDSDNNSKPMDIRNINFGSIKVERQTI